MKKTAATKKQATKRGETRKGKAVAKAKPKTAPKRAATAGRTAVRKKTKAAPWGYTNEGIPRRKPGVKAKTTRRA